MIIERYERPVDFTTPALSSPILQDSVWILDDPKQFALLSRSPTALQNITRGKPPYTRRSDLSDDLFATAQALVVSSSRGRSPR